MAEVAHIVFGISEVVQRESVVLLVAVVEGQVCLEHVAAHLEVGHDVGHGFV